MLNNFRNFAGSLWSKLLMGLLIAAFAAWGIEDIVRSPGRNSPVADVGKLSISQERFWRALQSENDTLRRILGDNYSPDIIKNMQLPERVLQRLVRHDLLQLENESLGLLPSDSDVVRRISQNPNFQDKKGHFDKVLFQKALRQAGITEKAYVEGLRQDITADILIDALLTPLTPPENAVRTLYQAREERRTAMVYTLTPSMVDNLPAPEPALLEAYYKEHAREFTVPEYRTVSFITLNAKDVPAAGAPSTQALQAAYQERIDEFRRPERRHVEQLLFSDEAAAKKAHKALSSGENFAKVGQSPDVINKDAISLGVVDRSAVIESSADAVFALKPGAFTTPTKSPFGWHIFRVSKIEPASVLPFEDVRAALEKDLKLRQGDDALSTTANALEDSLAGGSTLAEIAAQMKLKVTTLAPINRYGKTIDGGQPQALPAYDKFLDTAFKTDEKTESQLISVKGGGYYVLRVEHIKPEHQRPLEEVKSVVTANWQKQERTSRLADLARTVADKFTAPATRAAAISQYQLQALGTGALKRDNAGAQQIPGILLVDIFSRKSGESTGAYPAEGGTYMIAVVGNIIPAPAPENGALTETRKNLAATTQNEIIEQYMNHLEQKYSVSINESAIAALLRE